ncbi:MAG TPA: hypothetical protein PLJ30_06850 [Deltaproteobacteria bacterium]|nr:hypothetical protein [Deltaproteobacteria bacterium]
MCEYFSTSVSHAPIFEGAAALPVDDLLDPCAVFRVVVGHVIDLLAAHLAKDDLAHLPVLDLDLVEKPALEDLAVDLGDLPEVGGVEVEGAPHGLHAPGVVGVARETEHHRVRVAIGAKRGRTHRPRVGCLVVDAPCRLVRHDDIRLHRAEEAIHLVVLLIRASSRLILHDIALRNACGPHVGPAVAADLEPVFDEPVQVQIVVVQRGELEVHVVVARKAVDG